MSKAFFFLKSFLFILQIADEMANRIIELESKVRTPDCDILENEYRDNLADLRLLVAKEYCTMLIGKKHLAATLLKPTYCFFNLY